MSVSAQRPDPDSRPETPTPQATPADKRPFVEPAISSPVDVLEATTFFQGVDSGGSGFRKKGGGED